MKFFHLSDLHIGKQLFQYSLQEEQKQLLDQVVELARERKPDGIIIAGDIYDKSVPSAEAVQIFDAFLTEISQLEPKVPVFLIAGNHDSAKRLDYAKDILKKQAVYIAGNPPVLENQFLTKVTLQDEYGPLNVYLLPFMKPGHVRGIFPEVDNYTDAVTGIIQRENINTQERNILITHQFYVNGGESPERSESELITVGSVDNVDISAVEVFDYVAMGHIHRQQQVKEPRFFYSGTLFPYSVSEAKYEKYLLEVELKDKRELPVIIKLPVKTARTVAGLQGTLEYVISQADMHSEDYVSIVLTDEKIPYEAKETLESYFSNILEIRFDNVQTRELLREFEEEMESVEPLEVFCSFFRELHQRDLSKQELKEMIAVVNDAKERETR